MDFTKGNLVGERLTEGRGVDVSNEALGRQETFEADLREDLRDAAAFAPLAAVKVIERCATALTARPKRTIAVIAGFAIVAASMAAICRKKA